MEAAALAKQTPVPTLIQHLERKAEKP